MDNGAKWRREQNEKTKDSADKRKLRESESTVEKSFNDAEDGKVTTNPVSLPDMVYADARLPWSEKFRKLADNAPELIRSHNSKIRDERTGWRIPKSAEEPYNPGVV